VAHYWLSVQDSISRNYRIAECVYVVYVVTPGLIRTVDETLSRKLHLRASSLRESAWPRPLLSAQSGAKTPGRGSPARGPLPRWTSDWWISRRSYLSAT
jgi:hypothetical protein